MHNSDVDNSQRPDVVIDQMANDDEVSDYSEENQWNSVVAFEGASEQLIPIEDDGKRRRIRREEQHVTNGIGGNGGNGGAAVDLSANMPGARVGVYGTKYTYRYGGTMYCRPNNTRKLGHSTHC